MHSFIIIPPLRSHAYTYASCAPSSTTPPTYHPPQHTHSAATASKRMSRQQTGATDAPTNGGQGGGQIVVEPLRENSIMVGIGQSFVHLRNKLVTRRKVRVWFVGGVGMLLCLVCMVGIATSVM